MSAEKILTVEVIGDAGAFDTELVNSSFLIRTTEGQLLFDCGWNVFPELLKRDLVKDITCIYISHMDDDHMGSAKSLIYYRYFVLGQTTKIYYSSCDVESYFSGINYKWKSSGLVYTAITKCEFLVPENMRVICGVKINVVPGIHHIKSHGIVIRDSEKLIAISGDTKANFKFEKSLNKLREFLDNIDITRCLIFHDYSFWNVPSKQVHACESDFQEEYTQEFKEQAILYHNDQAGIAGNIYRFDEERKKWYQSKT